MEKETDLEDHVVSALVAIVSSSDSGASAVLSRIFIGVFLTILTTRFGLVRLIRIAVSSGGLTFVYASNSRAT